MKRAWILSAILLAVFLVIPTISAEIIFNSQPNAVYNLGDVVSVPITLKATSDMQGSFNIDLLCDGSQTNFYKSPTTISLGQEKNFDASLILTRGIIGNLQGACKLKAYFDSEYALTNEFKISNTLNINATFSKLQVNPGNNVTVKGKVIREDGNPANGILNFTIVTGNSTSLTQLGTINSGSFSVSLKMPKSMKAGPYLAEISATEKDGNGNVTNHGLVDQNIQVNQVPTSLEIIFDNSSIEPGTNARVKAILHDQTGDKVDSLVFLTVKDENNKIMDQQEVSTDEFLEYPIAYNEPPGTWKVAALSNKLTSEAVFSILPKESVDIQVINQTIIATNKGNVPYNKTAVIKIGNETLNVPIYLDIDQSQKYLLSAPDGKYKVQISVGENNSLSRDLSLTGNSINVKKSGSGVTGFFSNSLLWVFVIFILGFVLFIVFKKGYQKAFIGYVRSGRKHKHPSADMTPKTQSRLIPTRHIAELSLSIKGEKQDVSVAALKIKNIKDIQKNNEGTMETLKKIADLSDSAKAVVYENQDTVFFIFAPAVTRTFKNEMPALELAMKIKEALSHHNKLFKQRINFGVSLNYGSIVAKREGGQETLKFMSMGTLVTSSKKLASLAENDILLGEKIYDRMRSEVKATKHTHQGMTVFSVNEIRHTEDHNKFLKGFLHRMDKDEAKSDEKRSNEGKR